jgi:glutamate synthase (NADPH/NADH) small chain
LVTVFEKADAPGGLLRFGIPDFKLEKTVLDRRLEQLRAEGVVFKTGIECGINVSGEELKEKFDAVCLTVGAENPRDLLVPGRELKGVHFAMEYLSQQNRINSKLLINNPKITASGKRVVILGGGDTGSDCLGTAHRQRCASVQQFEIMKKPTPERSGETPWPQWPIMLRSSHAHEEGGSREWGVSTLRFEGEDGNVKRLVGEKTAEDGSRKPFSVEADLVLLAMGFTGTQNVFPLLDQLKIPRDAQGRVLVDYAYMTPCKGVFAAGDAKRGASLIVWAIAEGRKMAAAVDQFLKIK